MTEKALLRSVFSRLAGGQNIALVAPVSGETSRLLREIGAVYQAWLPDNSAWIFAYVSAAEFGPDDTAADFWQRSWQAFVEQSPEQPWRMVLDKLAAHSTTQPLRSNRLWRELDKQQVRLVLLVENLDQLAENPHLFTPDLLGPLRSLSSRYQSFCVVFSSQKRLRELNQAAVMAGSPPFNNFNEVLLSEFVEA